MNKIGQLSKFCLRKSPHVRASLCLPTETGSWLCKVPSPVLTSQPVRTIYVEDLPQSETPVIGIYAFNYILDICLNVVGIKRIGITNLNIFCA